MPARNSRPPQFKNQQREIAHLQKFVDRFGAKASMASRAKSKEKQIERLKEVAVEEPSEDLRKINFQFPQPPRSGSRSSNLKNVKQAYGDHVVYRDLNFDAERGQEHRARRARTGAGKSTLLKILAGVIPIQGGTSRTRQQRRPRATSRRTALDNLKPDTHGLRERDGAAHQRKPAHRATSPRRARRPFSSAKTTSTSRSPCSPAVKNPASRSPACSCDPPNLPA